MNFRKAVKSDIKEIMGIISQAQIYFKECNIDQWQDNYPNSETIKEDMLNKHSYVLLKSDKIVATVSASFQGEKTYDAIYNGQWISNYEYVVMHRLAVHEKYKGLGLSNKIIKNIEKIALGKNIHSIKVDTHKDNISMKKVLIKNNFKYCGIIYLEDGSERIAFEKII